MDSLRSRSRAVVVVTALLAITAVAGAAPAVADAAPGQPLASSDSVSSDAASANTASVDAASSTDDELERAGGGPVPADVPENLSTTDPPALPAETAEPRPTSSGDGQVQTVASASGAEIDVTVTYWRRPELEDTVEVERRYEFGPDVTSFAVGSWTNEEVVEVEGFQADDVGYTWNGTTDVATITVNRTLSGGLQADGDDWSVADQQLLSWQARGYETPTYSETHVLADDQGFVGNQLVVFGPYDEYVRSPEHLDLRVILPGDVTTDPDPEDVADELAAVARDYRVANDRDDATIVAFPDTIGGYAKGGDAVVGASESLHTHSVWHHEFAHTQQSFRATRDLEWFFEGQAEYVQYRVPSERGYVDYETFVEELSVDDVLYSDVVLSEFETWDGSNANYYVGALAIQAIDATIREETGGDARFLDVVRELNEYDDGPYYDQEAVGHAAFLEAVRSVGGERAETVAANYTETTARPDVVDRDTWETTIGPEDVERGDVALTARPADPSDRRVDPASTDEALGTVRHDVAESGADLPERTVEATIALPETSDALAGYDLEVSVADTDVLAVADVRPGPAFEAADRDASPGVASLSATGNVTEGAEDVHLATVELAVRDAGTASLDGAATRLHRADGSTYAPRESSIAVDVERQLVPTVDGTTPRDVDGDGYYRDLTGDETVGNRDVGRFFEHFHRSTLDVPALFDFSGNDNVSHGDVVTLFQRVLDE